VLAEFEELNEYLHIAGQSQSPAGNFAVTSILPYLIDFLPRVVRRADLTGGIMDLVVEFDAIEQVCGYVALVAFAVQEASPPELVRFSV
jgi:hypothetical protein